VSKTAILKVWRGDSPGDGRFDVFAVAFEPGQSVLDGLRWIRAHEDPTLAIRFSCINANACKECMIELDGRTVYACTARLEAREMTLTPLSNKQLVRDLVTEIAPPSERFAGATASLRIIITAAIATASLVATDAGRAADPLVGCYKRAYAASHLAAHPGQTVTAMTLRARSISENGQPIGGKSHSANLTASFRGKKKRGFGDSDCAASGQSLLCVLDSERGRFRLTKWPSGMVLEPDTDLRMHEPAEGPFLAAISPSNPEERKFLLTPVAGDVCDRDLEQLEQS
jgi:2Fe-2S iron-sulfur cluster binding domain